MANEPNITLSIFQILGGVALFLFGIRRVTKSLEDLAGAGFRLVITRLVKSRFRGFGLGVIVALSLQSSGAVMLMLAALANSFLITLANSVSVILGAGLGSTLTVQILAFKIHAWAPVMLIVGFVVRKVFREGSGRDIGDAVFGFGLLFLGMHLITGGTAPLVEEEVFPAAIVFFRRTPLFAAILAAGLTVLFQSSAAMLGLLLTLGFSGILDIHSAIPFIIGANIGSCGIAFLGTAGDHGRGRRLAWTELTIRVATGIVVYMLANQYAAAATALANSPARQIAHLHTMFALTAGVLFLPFSNSFARFIERVIPGPDEKKFGPRYLDSHALSNPPTALGNGAREILRQGDVVLSMMDDMITALSKNDIELLNDIISRDDRVDALQEAITQYLTRLSESELSSKESETELQLLTFTLELEHVADVISKDIARYVEKRHEEGYYFSREGFEEIREYHSRVRELMRKTISAIPLRDKDIAREIVDETKELIELHRELKKNHIFRLHAGVRFTAETSTIHLDLLADLSRIAVHLSHIGYALMGKV